MSSMLGLLGEYGIWPHVINASAISNGLKVTIIEHTDDICYKNECHGLWVMPYSVVTSFKEISMFYCSYFTLYILFFYVHDSLTGLTFTEYIPV